MALNFTKLELVPCPVREPGNGEKQGKTENH